MGLGFIDTRIGQRLLAVFLAISLLPLLAIGWFAIQRSEASLHRETFAVLRAATDGAEGQIREFLLHLKEKTIGLSRDRAICEVLEKADLTKESIRAEVGARLSQDFAERQQEFPDAQELFILALDGRVVASSLSSSIGQRPCAAEYFERGKQSFFPGDVLREPVSHRLTWVMSAPIRSKADNRLLAVLACRVDPRTLSALTTGRRVMAQGADTQCFRIGDSGETYIVNRDHLMITESRFIDDAVLKVKVDTLPIRRAWAEGKETTTDYKDYRGIQVSGASTLLPDMGWVVLTEIDFSQAFVPLEQLRNALLCATIGLCLVVIFLAYYSARRLVRPIHVLNQSDKALAAGNESAALVSELGLPCDELGDLVRSRNTRIKSLFAHHQQLLEEQRKHADAVAELERMSYSIMHDMRAPLRAIIGFGEVIQETDEAHLGLESRKYLARMQQAAGRMDRLICDVLNYNRIVMEELPLYPVNVIDLARGIVETYPVLQPFKTGIHLPSESHVVLGNEAALTQCFSNLLENAVKFRKPEVALEIRIRFEDSKDRVRIWIEDNGVGIPRGSEERIFDIFQRGANSPEGTGIGLAIVRKAVERMGGRAGVVSQSGSGSRFWLELPLVKTDVVAGSRDSYRSGCPNRTACRSGP